MAEKNVVIGQRVSILMFSLFALFLNIVVVNAQQFKIGKNIANLKLGGILELEDSAKALILTRIADPSVKIGSNSYRGMIVFDSLKNQMSYYDGTNWQYPLVDSSAFQNIYNSNGTLSYSRTINKGGQYLRFVNMGGDTLALATNGSVSIGTTDSTYRLNIKGGTTNSLTDINSRTIAINGDPIVYYDNNNSYSFGATSGLKSLQNNTGTFNIAVGPAGLDKNTTGQRNIGIGLGALRFNTTGSYNTAVGSTAFYNITGSNNVAIGNDAMGTATAGTADNNVAVGAEALFNLRSNSNVGIGYQAGKNLTTGTNNIAIGANTNFQSITASNQLNIGNLIYADSVSQIGIGIVNPYTKVDVLGNIYLTNHANTNLHDISERGTRRIGQKAGNTNDGFNGLEFSVDSFAPTGNHGSIKFMTWAYSVSGTREVARVDGKGNFGIGTNTPSRGLQVVKGIATDSLTVVGSNNMLKLVKGITSNSSLLMEFYKNGTSTSDYGARSGYFGFGSSANNNFAIMNQLKGLFQIGTNNVNVMTIDTFTNVGIGVSTPISKLHVNGGAVRADSLVLTNLALDTNNYNANLTIDINGVVRLKTLANNFYNILQGQKATGGNAFGDTVRIGSYDAQPIRLLSSNSPGITIKPTGTKNYVPMDSNTIYLRNIAYDAGSPITLYTTGSNNTLASGPLSNVIDNKPNTGILIYDANAGNTQAFNIQLNDFYYIDSVVLISSAGPATNTGSTNNAGLSFAHVQLFNGGTSIQDYYLNQPSYTANEPYGVKMNGGLANVVRVYQISQSRLFNFLISEVYIYGRRAKAIYSGTTETRVNGSLALDNVTNGLISDSILVINNSNVKKVSASGNYWSTTGNSGTNPSTNFIGTTDDNDVVFKRSNQKAGLLSIDNTAFGIYSLSSNMGLYNIAVGGYTLTSNRGNWNTGIGGNALVFNTTGSNNTATGGRSLYSNTTGSNNTATGYYALYSNTTGGNNTAMGYYALYTNTVGTNNTAIGNNALYNNALGGGSNNTAIGNNALYTNTIGGTNTAFGSNALYNSLTGYDNTAMGYNAGSNINVGINNIAIGANAQVPSNSGSNQLSIGNAIYGTNVNSGSVANIGINTNAPSYNFQVNGTAAGTNAWVVTSDMRLKKNIMPLDSGISKIMQLRPVSYEKKRELQSIDYEYNEMGFIAQEVRKVLPMLVTEAKDSAKILSLNYDGIIPILTKAIQEQQKEIEGLRNKVQELDTKEQQVTQLQNEVNELKVMLQEIHKLIKK